MLLNELDKIQRFAEFYILQGQNSIYHLNQNNSNETLNAVIYKIQNQFYKGCRRTGPELFSITQKKIEARTFL